MARFATVVESTGVGSYHVGIRDLVGTPRRAVFQFISSGDFSVNLNATLDFNFDTNVGTGWFNVNDKAQPIVSGAPVSVFVQIGGNLQLQGQVPGQGVPITEPGVYAFDEGFMPAGFQFDVTSVTSGAPVKILFGV